MKKLIQLTMLTGSIMFLLHADQVTDWTRPAPYPVPGCHAKGVTMQTFYGNREDILRAVRRTGDSLNDFRMHLVFVESSNGAEALLYEKSNGQWDVKSWKGKSIGDVRHRLDAMVLKTRGSACAGEELKRVLADHQINLKGNSTAKVETMESILVPVLDSYQSGYLRVTFLDPCETGTGNVNVASR